MPSDDHTRSFSMFLIDNGTLDACRLRLLWGEWSNEDGPSNVTLWDKNGFHLWLSRRYPQEHQIFRAKMRVLYGTFWPGRI